MCIKIEEVRTEVENALEENNKKRDKNLDEKLSSTRKKIYEHFEELINPLRLEHDSIKSDCVFRKNEQETLKIYLNEHTEQNREDFDKLMQEVKRMNETVNDKLLPAYEEAQKKEIAIQWLKDKAKSWQFWLKAFVSLIILISVLKWILNIPTEELKF